LGAKYGQITYRLNDRTFKNGAGVAHLIALFPWPVGWYLMNKWARKILHIEIEISWWGVCLCGAKLRLTIAVLTVSYPKYLKRQWPIGKA